MYRTYLLITSIFICCLAPAGAQSLPVINTIKRAELSYAHYAYAEALELFKEAYRKDTANAEVARRIADCHIKLNDSKASEYWIRKHLELGGASNQDTHFLLAEQLSKNENYTEAYIYYQKASANPLAKKKLLGLGKLDQLARSAAPVEVEALDFNTDESEFGPFYYKGSVAFVSSRSRRSWVQSQYNWDKSDYLDFYHYQPQDSSRRIERIVGLNSRYHEGPAQVFDNGAQIVFTRSNVQKSRLQKDAEGVTNLQLFFAKLDSTGVWTAPEAFEHNEVNYSSGHPTISEDGQLLIYASNQLGTYGGTDLFFSRMINGSWSRPANMGDVVNTTGDEMFPFLSDNRLYFASNGHEGLGGLDLYEVTLSDGLADGAVSNMGAPFNSSQDDFGLITADGLITGYFASSRFGSDDIFQFRRTSMNIKGRVVDQETGEPLANVQLVLEDEGKPVGQVASGEDGRFVVEMGHHGKFEIYASKKDLQQVDSCVFELADASLDVGEIKMVRSYLEVTIQEAKSGGAVDGVDLMLVCLDDASTVTRRGGTTTFKIDPAQSYLLMLIKDGYYTKRDTIASDRLDLGRNVENVELKKIVVGESIRLDHIYYDVNSAHLRPESEVELDKLVLFMTDNSHLKIELSSHTDSRGSAPYNMKLSQERAESAANYLINQGIEDQRIVPKGYGEAKLLNNCRDGVKCSDQDHQANRRTELTILKIE